MTPVDPVAEHEQTVIPDFVIDTMARCLLPQIQAYYASPEGQAAFEEWKRGQENHSIQGPRHLVGTFSYALMLSR